MCIRDRKCISHVLGKDVEGDVLAFGVKEEKPAQTVELTGCLLYTSRCV